MCKSWTLELHHQSVHSSLYNNYMLNWPNTNHVTAKLVINILIRTAYSCQNSQGLAVAPLPHICTYCPFSDLSLGGEAPRGIFFDMPNDCDWLGKRGILLPHFLHCDFRSENCTVKEVPTKDKPQKIFELKLLLFFFFPQHIKDTSLTMHLNCFW